MTTFNEFTAELANNDLLDEAKFIPNKLENLATSDLLLSSINLRSNLINLSENHDLKLPDFSFLQNETNFSQTNISQLRAIFPDHFPNNSIQSTKNLLKHKKRRHKVKRANIKGKYCNTCSVKVHSLSFRCRYCREKVAGNFYYFSVLMFSAVTLTVLVWLIVSNRSYN